MSQPGPSSPATGVPTCYRHPDRETYISCQRCGRPICPDCMRDAAVGFQCPQCVAEGAKATRSGRTAYGGLRSGNPGLTSGVLIAINAAVWLAVMLTGAGASRLVSWLAIVPNGACGSRAQPGATYPRVVDEQTCLSIADGTWIPGVDDGAWWQLATNAFTHVEVWHIGFNMLALWILGPQLELAIGRVRFLVLYLGSALAGSAMVYWFAPINQATLGASGAIFGLMAGLLVLAYKVRGNVQFILMWLGINALITVAGRGFISWQGHLGGFLGGLALAAIIIYAPRERRSVVQAAGIGAVLLAVLVAIAARTAALA
jgi:membrane associated rhomboid family serine protease